MSNLMNFSCPEGTFTLPQDAAFHTVNIIAFPDGSNITINRDKYAQGSTFADYLAGQMQKLNGGLPGFKLLNEETLPAHAGFTEAHALGFTFMNQTTPLWQFTALAQVRPGELMLFAATCPSEQNYNLMRDRILTSVSDFTRQ
ncbi:DcrB-related protein [Pantoea sp. MBD-2R]|uniref:DcrB-related protein n=1 Tax=unclassified Pantoea TaxID=2630326 RepID=UPI0011BE66C9|nr:DcrB-related protein [Pantoea sp. CCBC3-3-1]